MSTDRRLIVATHRRWVADELCVGAVGKAQVEHNLGFEVPRGDLSDAAWWTPHAHAARLVHAGVSLRLAVPEVTMLSVLPHAATGREVLTCLLSEVTGKLKENGWKSGWCKPADAKVEKLPAQWWDSLHDFDKAAKKHLPLNAYVQITPTRLNITTEHRFTVIERKVVATSPYLHNGKVWEEGMQAPGSSLAQKHVESVLQELQSVPSAMVLDVGITDKGPVLVEANPVWCAAFYGADTTYVVDALLKASGSANPEWAPDAWAEMRAMRQRVLPAA